MYLFLPMDFFLNKEHRSFLTTENDKIMLISEGKK